MSNPREVMVGDWIFDPYRKDYYRDPVDRYTMGPGVTALLTVYLAMKAENAKLRSDNERLTAFREAVSDGYTSSAAESIAVGMSQRGSVNLGSFAKYLGEDSDDE